MAEQTQTEEELCVLSADFADLIKKIAQYVKNETKMELITSIGALSSSKSIKDVPLTSETDKAIPMEQTVIYPPYDLHELQNSASHEKMLPNQNLMSKAQQYNTTATSQQIDEPVQTNLNCNPSAQELSSIAEPTFQNEHAKVMKTISQHLWLIEDLLKYPYNENNSIVRQFFEYIQNCLRNDPVLITIFNENPSKPTGLLFAKSTDKLKELAEIIRFNANWLKSWLSDQFLSETIAIYSESQKKLQEQTSSHSNIGDYLNFSTDFHSTKNVVPPVEVSKNTTENNDSGYAEQSNGDDVIEELLQTLDAVRLRALINQYDRDYDDRLRENVTRILNKPYVAEDSTKTQIPVTMQLLDTNKKLACRLGHAEDQITDLQKLMTHFNQSLELNLSNKEKTTISSTTMTDPPNPIISTNRWFSPF